MSIYQVTCEVCESSRVLNGSSPATVDYSGGDTIGIPVSIRVCQNTQAIEEAVNRGQKLVLLTLDGVQSAITHKDYSCPHAREDE